MKWLDVYQSKFYSCYIQTLYNQVTRVGQIETFSGHEKVSRNISTKFLYERPIIYFKKFENFGHISSRIQSIDLRIIISLEFNQEKIIKTTFELKICIKI